VEEVPVAMGSIDLYGVDCTITATGLDTMDGWPGQERPVPVRCIAFLIPIDSSASTFPFSTFSLGNVVSTILP
jgi:hypothetical protein